MLVYTNYLDGKYAVPDHPITCANPAPWLIIELKIEERGAYIRGEGSMWFRLDHCLVGDLDELQEVVYLRELEELKERLYFQGDTL